MGSTRKRRHPGVEPAGPVRTCVGCRGRDSDSRLLRIVLDGSRSELLPDPRRRAPGRGVWVHRDEQCITTALDRRALTRSLRIDAGASTDAVVEVLDRIRAERDGHEERRTDQTR